MLKLFAPPCPSSIPPCERQRPFPSRGLHPACHSTPVYAETAVRGTPSSGSSKLGGL
jgi:hypothetical protein